MPHQKSSAELQELGKILYRRKDYSKALEHFNEAISSEPNLSVSLLDNRAATYDKLDDVASALKDAKNAIRLHEKDPTGYLRAGKLLEKAGKPNIALSIYKHGIKKKTRNVEILQKLHDKLLHSTAPATAADPFAQLPIELVEMILAHLSFRQIVSCTSVSKQWNNFIARLPNLWVNLDLSDARRRVKNDFISICLNRSDRRIKSANLKLLAGSDKAITALTRRCHGLHTLSILDGGVRSSDFIHQLTSAHNLTTLKLGVEAPMGLDSITLLLRQINSLKCVEILSAVARQPATWAGEFHNLESLTIMSDAANSDFQLLHLEQFAKRAPNLRRLVISHFTTQAFVLPLNLQLHCTQLTELDFDGCYLKRDLLPTPGLPPSVRILRANQSSGSVYLVAMMGISMTPATHFLPHLEELQVSCPEVANLALSNREMIPHIDERLKESWKLDHSIMDVLKKDPNQLSKLRALSMKLDGGFYPPEIRSQLVAVLSSPRLSELQTLRLTCSHYVDDSSAELIALSHPDIKVLNLSKTAVTGYGVRKIVEGCKKLTLLTLNGCEKCGPDAIEWARNQGVRVDFMLGTGHETKSKKLRW